MTITAKDYALLSRDAYNDREKNKTVVLGGITYTVIDNYSDPISGYQATAYQRADTHEVVIANRGTEMNWGGGVQDVAIDLGMLATGLNAQMLDARAFANRVNAETKNLAVVHNYPLPPITVTGHSLGGAITEILAHDMHWQGVTFNGYGAVGLGYHLSEGGTQVTNYVRVTDVVSAASHH